MPAGISVYLYKAWLVIQGVSITIIIILIICRCMWPTVGKDWQIQELFLDLNNSYLSLRLFVISVWLSKNSSGKIEQANNYTLRTHQCIQVRIRTTLCFNTLCVCTSPTIKFYVCTIEHSLTCIYSRLQVGWTVNVASEKCTLDQSTGW